ncbi:SDR family oxidoreductase [Winogradskya humida]|uniref:Short-chain dehydrogenase n=1 Tax=Winogradskya humida TaxID=113566 RepID=A0ABQ4A5Y2_9ACTN|nr:SDR family oxidoreductase [Actinoplanes humidus]GIE26275.1 short-chain dehydrogenase [Actinoplanes humidus]
MHVASRGSAKVAAIAGTDPDLIAHQLDGNDATAVAKLAADLAPIDSLIVTLSGGEGAGMLAAMPGTAGLGALNAAVEALVRPLAVELAPRRVNAVSPGLVDTPWWNGMPEQDRIAWFASAAAGLPVGHVSIADEIAEAVALLATNPSATGTILTIDGGARLVQL